MRDKLIHEYFGVELELVWQATSSSVPELDVRIARLLEEENEIP